MAFDAPAMLSPAAGPLAWRNAALDWTVYDVAALSPAEIGLLAAETALEGAILVVHPNPEKAGVAVEKFEGLAAFRAAPGPPVRHLALAGVGRSDLGAAALGRALANHLGAPVAAIVAGYGAAELMEEAAGGRFLFRHAGARRVARRWGARATAEAALGALEAGRAEDRLGFEAATLLSLLREPGRRPETLLAHSRGALALSFATNVLALADPGAFARLGAARVVTAGAVQPFPEGLGAVLQILGALDWYGELNSDPAVPRVLAPRAWHHLNPQVPAHLDLPGELARRLP